ncbi:MAG TPA: hypothetical protein VF695_06290 [Sphingomonas sp.]|jgi:hypothetical protein
MHEHKTTIGMAYIALAAVSGALTALGFVKWRDMSKGELALTFAGGFSFAIFVTPWVAHSMMGIDEGNVRAIAGMTYVFGSGSNILLPAIIRFVRRSLDTGEAK